jgi:glycosyltransferase involved in cell wall biosynthesis
MIYVFYNNDPLAQDLGGGAEHFRCLHRALAGSGLPFRLIGTRLQSEKRAPEVIYVSKGSSFPRYYLALWRWFWRHRREFEEGDVFHFHRNYAAWPKLLLCPAKGSVLVSYHNVTGLVLEGWLGRLAAPVRKLMLALERRVAALADAIICVSSRDRKELAEVVAEEPFERAHVVPAAYDQALFDAAGASPPPPELARRLLVLGRLSHQKNVPLAVATLEALVAAGPDEGWRLTIAGRGEDSADLIRLIAKSPAAASITWIGAVPHDEVPALLADHGALLLTSRYEASPTVVKEALRAMRPVVSTDVGDVGDWLDPEQTGFVCEASPERLAEGVRLAAKLVEEGRYQPTRRLDQLDESRLMNQVITVYRQLAML